ncbi:MAG: MATE family efflux transporter, partial [bacterium]
MASSSENAASHFRKMSETPVPKLVGKLAVPAIISMLVTNIYNLVDTAFVGRLGTSASGAVGIVFGFMSIIQAFGFMYGQGAGSILARALGQKDIPKASLHVTMGFLGALFTGALISVIGF